jgi:hypothetical protein
MVNDTRITLNFISPGRPGKHVIDGLKTNELISAVLAATISTYGYLPTFERSRRELTYDDREHAEERHEPARRGRFGSFGVEAVEVKDHFHGSTRMVNTGDAVFFDEYTFNLPFDIPMDGRTIGKPADV